MSSARARIPEHSVMDAINRVLDEYGEIADRVTIVIQSTDGESSHIISNARSENEMNGMLYAALNYQVEVDTEEEDD